jgi:bacterioferritin-associated ferredoxin
MLNKFKLSKTYGDPTANKFIELYLDIDKKDKFSGFGFFQRGFDHLEEQLHILRDSILDKRIDEVREISFKSSVFLDIPTLILFDLIEEYKGMIALEDERLLCRCFGITSNQVQKILRSNPDLSVQDITDQTNAGGGCTSCSSDIEKIVESFKFKNSVEFVNPSKRILGMTPVDFLIQIDESLSRGFGSKVKIFRFRENYLFLKADDTSKEEIVTFLNQEFPPHFPLTLLLV